MKAAKVELAEAAKGKGKPKDADLKPIPKSKIMGATPSLPKDGSTPPPVAYKQMSSTRASRPGASVPSGSVAMHGA
eukprot:8013693-Pyramimonas_sp.AAC.1